MSKQIKAAELAEIVNKLLTNPQGVGMLEEASAFSAFMTDVAQVVCDFCGGEIHHRASPLDDTWYVGIHGNESQPTDPCIWEGYDTDGSLNGD